MLRILFWLSFAAVGLYYEWGAALMSGALLVHLWRKKKLRWRLNDAFLAAAGISLFYAVGWLWAVDSGVAVWGAVKHLPVVLFALALLQEEPEGRLRLLRDIPWMGAAMTALSFALQFVPVLAPALTVSGRLAGLFQYPNTYACFTLLGLEILLLDRETKQDKRWLGCCALLLLGLFQSGSRAVWVLAVPALAVTLLLRREGKTLLRLALCGGAMAALSVALAALDIGGADRVTEISTGASTLLGRLLYWKDALPQIGQHPFGLGYLGYYFTQGSFQSGVYAVRWVHNDLLQLLLDVGWVPALLAVTAAVKALFSRRMSAMHRVVLVTLLGHCMFDFNLQFAAMYFVVLLCLDWEDMKLRTLTLPRWTPMAAAAVTALCLYIGAATALSYGGRYEAALKIYPWDTFSRLERLAATEDGAVLDRESRRILQQNESAALAWNAQALVAYGRGDFGTMMECKRQALALTRYQIAEYEDYFHRLRQGVQLYTQAGDSASAAACQREILAIDGMVQQVIDTTDPLAWRIADRPELELSAAYRSYVRKIQ